MISKESATTASGLTEKDRVKDLLLGRQVQHIKANGEITKGTVMASSKLRIRQPTKEDTEMIRKKDWG